MSNVRLAAKSARLTHRRESARCRRSAAVVVAVVVVVAAPAPAAPTTAVIVVVVMVVVAVVVDRRHRHARRRRRGHLGSVTVVPRASWSRDLRCRHGGARRWCRAGRGDRRRTVVGVEVRLVEVALVEGPPTVTTVARAAVPAVGSAGSVDVDASSPPLATVNPAATKAPEAARRASGMAWRRSLVRIGRMHADTTQRAARLGHSSSICGTSAPSISSTVMRLRRSPLSNRTRTRSGPSSSTSTE